MLKYYCDRMFCSSLMHSRNTLLLLTKFLELAKLILEGFEIREVTVFGTFNASSGAENVVSVMLTTGFPSITESQNGSRLNSQSKFIAMYLFSPNFSLSLFKINSMYGSIISRAARTVSFTFMFLCASTDQCYPLK